eukprot:scpid19069/ scgid31850/ Tuberin; Tuberous sclerosis 2 protein homolog
MAKDSLRLKFQQLLGQGNKRGGESSGGLGADFQFTTESLKSIGCGAPQESRLRLLKDLEDVVSNQHFEEFMVEAVWMEVNDLLEPQQTAEVRQQALTFLSFLAKGQVDRLGPCNLKLFDVVTQPEHLSEDFVERMLLLSCITNEGRSITFIQRDLDHFIRTSLPTLREHEQLLKLLDVLVMVVQYNAAFLSDNTRHELVKTCAIVCHQERCVDYPDACIKLLDRILRGCSLRCESLEFFVLALCHTVNQEQFCTPSWELIRKLLGTHMGHAGVEKLCYLLSCQENYNKPGVIRGAIFFLSMSLWGSKHVPSLQRSFATVLPSFVKALECVCAPVAYELALSMNRLVKKYGTRLQQNMWGYVIDVLEIISRQTPGFNSQTEQTRVFAIRDKINDTLTTMEKLYDAGTLAAKPDMFFNLLEKWVGVRSPTSTELIIKFRISFIHPAESCWVEKLNQLIEKFYKSETRQSVRICVLDVVFDMVNAWCFMYPHEMLDQIVLYHMRAVHREPLVAVRTAVTQHLVSLAQQCSDVQHFEKIVYIIYKVASRSLDVPANITEAEEEDTLRDATVAVTGLVSIFKYKLFHLPTAHVSYVFQLLLTHMKKQYELGYSSHVAAQLKIAVFDCLMSLRANSQLRLGLQSGEDTTEFSDFIYCDGRDLLQVADTFSGEGDPLPIVPVVHSTLHFADVMHLIEVCLEQEKQYSVVDVVLRQLSRLLHHRLLILSTDCDLNNLGRQLCELAKSSRRCSLKDMPISAMDISIQIYPVLTALVPYCSKLTKSTQMILVQSLENGLVAGRKSCRACVVALSLSILEMQSVITLRMESLLHRLTLVSAAPSLAAPVLELLSNLVQISSLYASFNAEQYKSIFAIILPYVDPSQFSLYIVTLAHHVLALWFVRCRVPQKNFVTFILNKLRHISQHMQSNLRSSSILSDTSVTSAGSGTVTPGLEQSGRHSRHSGRGSDASPAVVRSHDFSRQQRLEENLHIHEELCDVCLDMMMRYTHTACSTLHSWSPGSSKLLANGASSNWLIGHLVVTITTGKPSADMPISERSSTMSMPASPLSKTFDESVDAPSATESIGHVHGVTSIDSVASHSMSTSMSVSGQDMTAPLHQLHHSGSVSSCSTHGGGGAAGGGGGAGGGHSSVTGQSVAEDGTGTAADQSQVLQNGWAAITIRRPCSNTAWLMKLQNKPSIVASSVPSSMVRATPTLRQLYAEGDVTEAEMAAMLALSNPSAASAASALSLSRSVAASGPSSTTSSGPVSFSSTGQPSSLGSSHPRHPSALGLAARSRCSFDSTSLQSSTEKEPPPSSVHCLPEHTRVSDEDLPTIDMNAVKQRSSLCRQLSDSQLTDLKTPDIVGHPMMWEDGQATPLVTDDVGDMSPVNVQGTPAAVSVAVGGGSGLPSKHGHGHEHQQQQHREDRRQCPVASPAATVAATTTAATALHSHSHPVTLHLLRTTASRRRESSDSLESTAAGDESTLPVAVISPLATHGVNSSKSTGNISTSTGNSNGNSSHVVMSSTRPATTPMHANPAHRLQNTTTFRAMKSLQDLALSSSAASQEERDTGFHKLDGEPATAEFGSGVGGGISRDSPRSSTPVRTTTPTGFRPLEQHRPAMHVAYEQRAALARTRSPVVTPLRQSATPSGKCSSLPLSNTATPPEVKACSSVSAATQLPYEPSSLPLSAVSQVSACRQATSALLKSGSLDVSSPAVKPPIASKFDVNESSSELSACSQVMNFSSRHSSFSCGPETVPDPVGPSFIFLQLYQSGMLTSQDTAAKLGDRPIQLKNNEAVDRSLRVLDRTAPYETHRIGVLYVDKGQMTIGAALANTHGSLRYEHFLNGLGDWIALEDCDPRNVFLGGLSRDGKDGNWAISWEDDISQVIYHVATLMPSDPSDASCTGKLAHIGNDYVKIMYNNTGGDIKPIAKEGQFCFASIVITPLPLAINEVRVVHRDGVESFMVCSDSLVVSDMWLPTLVRQLAVHANLASQIRNTRKKGNEETFCSNWVERLRTIGRIRRKAINYGDSAHGDFTDFS